MTLLTIAEARSAARAAGLTASVAESALRKSAAQPRTARFDIFLSHSSLDAEVIAGVARILEREGKSVYIDWRDDPQLDRSRVTPATAALLRERMSRCSFLIFATSPNSAASRWMPWELGYFDGLRGEKVGILPLLGSPSQSWVGQEYLGLYPLYERISFKVLGDRLGRFTDRAANIAQPLSSAV